MRKSSPSSRCRSGGPSGRGRAQAARQSAEPHDAPVRLHKFLADQGIASRRKSEEMILQGLVQVNGQIVRTLGVKIDPRRDRVMVDGRPVKAPARQTHVYFILNKPRGFLVTADDPEGRKTIYELISSIRERLIPVGRLDRNSEGLLLLTNDGELAYRLMHPRYEIEKEYEVRIEGKITGPQMEQLRAGVELDGAMTGSAQVSVTEMDERGTRLSIVIKEGKKRQVRRMMESIGHDVRRLMRIREGSLRLGTLGTGKWRKLTPQEVTHLRKEAGLA